jgi:outer membrane protein OmpA-like peptidoglycan-associated protein
MKKVFMLLVAVGMTSMLFAQDTTTKKASIGFRVSYLDFKKTNQTEGLSKGVPAIGLQYFKGISSRLDFMANIDFASIKYPYYTSLKVPAAKSNQTYAALDLNMNYKLATDDKNLVPFITAGIGVGADQFSYYTAYAPVGAGLQIKAKYGSFVNIMSTYRAEASSLTKMHYSHSISYTLPIKGRDKKAIELPPAPIKVDGDDDGVSDGDDACPNQKGIAKYRGCPIPDTDNDGINDEQDQCPSTEGIAKYKGCPIPDTDRDGINDEQDKCPTTKGLGRYEGCPIPDTDKDGVNDEEDKCPTIAGISANKGCADLQPLVNAATAQLKFATGSNQLSKRQTNPLNILVQLLKDNPTITLVINGHTDNVGSLKINDQLSLSRAKVVLSNLVKKGVDPKRLTAKGFAFSMPIADNKLSKGRALNRRVEIAVQY